MVLVINGQDASWQPQGQTVGQVRQEVGGWAHEQGHALWEFKLNGQTVLPEDEADRVLSRHDRLEATTRDRHDILADLFCEVESYLPRLVKALLGVANMIYSGDESSAMDKFHQCLDGIEWTASAMRVASAICKNARSETVAPSIDQTLDEIGSALENRDMVMVADLIQVALCPAMTDWLDEISSPAC